MISVSPRINLNYLIFKCLSGIFKKNPQSCVSNKKIELSGNEKQKVSNRQKIFFFLCCKWQKIISCDKKRERRRKEVGDKMQVVATIPLFFFVWRKVPYYHSIVDKKMFELISFFLRKGLRINYFSCQGCLY